MQRYDVITTGRVGVDLEFQESSCRLARVALADRDLGVELAIVKRGAEGVLAATRASVLEVPPVRLKVVNGLGAGDAFGGALAHALVHGWGLRTALELANAAGALAASRLACDDDLGTLEEIESLLNISPRHAA